MSFNAKQIKQPANPNRKKAPPLEPGAYPGRLVQLINMGIQPGREFKGEVKPPRLTIRTTYEFLDEFLKDEDGNDILDKPRWLSEEFPLLSLKADLATSTKRYYALDPEDKADGDWSLLMGAPCMINVINQKDKRPGNDTVYDKISNISSMRPKEAAKAPALVNPPLIWDFYNPDVEVFKTFPDWLQSKIQDAVDYDGSKLQQLFGKKQTTEKVKNVVDEPVDDKPESGEPDDENW